MSQDNTVHSRHKSNPSSTQHIDIDTNAYSNLSRRTSVDSNTSSNNNPARNSKVFSVLNFAREMASSKRNSNKYNNNSNTDSVLNSGKDYQSITDYESEHNIDISSNGYSSYHNDNTDQEGILDRVKEVLPETLGGSPNPNDPRQAFRDNDIEASKRAHEIRLRNLRNGEPLEENHGNAASEHLKSIVYGGLDGIITTFATVTSVAGAHFSALVVIVLGISHLFADGLSMGLGDALSSQAEIDYNIAERKRERWEMDNNMSGEIEEMVAIYIKKGISKSDARSMIHTLAKYPDAFLDHMMVEELSLMPPDPDDNPKIDGAVTMASFMFFGSIPLTPYVLAHIPGFTKIMTDNVQLYSSIVLTVLTLFALGALKSTLVEGKRWIYGGLQVAVTGMIAAIVGWAAGAILSAIVPEAGQVVD